MKQWYRTTAAKVSAFFLCILCLVTVVGTVVGALVLTDYEFYTRPEQYIWEEQIYYQMRSEASNVLVHSFRMLEESYDSSYYYYAGYAYDPDVTNVRCQILAPNGEESYTNLEGARTADWSYEFRVAVWREITIYDRDDGLRVKVLSEDETTDYPVYTVRLYLEPGLPVGDEYAHQYRMIHFGYSVRYLIYPLGLAALILFFACAVLLIAVAGKRPGTEQVVAGYLGRIPFDLLFGATVLFSILLIYLIDYWYTGDFVLAVCQICWLIFAVSALLGLLMSASARIKEGTFLKNTVIWMVLRLLFRLLRWFWRGCGVVFRGILGFIRNIPILWRTALLALGLGAFDLLCVGIAWDSPGLAVLLAIAEFIAVSALALYSAWVMHRLKKSGEALAGGNLEHRTDTAGMLWDFKCHGENLNRIGVGMSRAVEERLRSERMKAELVTNVSHDIKTPLTSIINYADLIAGEPCASPTHREYAEVLLRKSRHLKRLLEDLVEISKANTGNLEMCLAPCDAGVLLTQTAGEFEQKCQEAGLELIASGPETGVRILADSRRIWRVFENLMNNACKYSLPGSRVYLTLSCEGGEAQFCFRNTSRAALNVSPEELMERFVRGDASRTTEGNGLGLSIARSLTELQGGRMELAIDGDLFKVTLRFPVLK